MAHHLAQLNVGRLRGPEGDPVVADFFANLDRINAVADGSPGFVWRLQTESGNATEVRPYEDELIAINLTVWESVDALKDYAYRSEHRSFLTRRREWFEPMADAYLVLWWIPAGSLPTVDEAVERLELLRKEGPSPRAFTFRTPFPPPDAPDAPG
jgi:hypothetical protein